MLCRIAVNIQNGIYKSLFRSNLFSAKRKFKKFSRSRKMFINGLRITVKSI